MSDALFFNSTQTISAQVLCYPNGTPINLATANLDAIPVIIVRQTQTVSAAPQISGYTQPGKATNSPLTTSPGWPKPTSIGNATVPNIDDPPHASDNPNQTAPGWPQPVTTQPTAKTG